MILHLWTNFIWILSELFAVKISRRTIYSSGLLDQWDSWLDDGGTERPPPSNRFWRFHERPSRTVKQLKAWAWRRSTAAIQSFLFQALHCSHQRSVPCEVQMKHLVLPTKMHFCARRPHRCCTLQHAAACQTWSTKFLIELKSILIKFKIH